MVAALVDAEKDDGLREVSMKELVAWSAAENPAWEIVKAILDQDGYEQCDHPDAVREEIQVVVRQKIVAMPQATTRPMRKGDVCTFPQNFFGTEIQHTGKWVGLAVSGRQRGTLDGHENRESSIDVAFMDGTGIRSERATGRSRNRWVTKIRKKEKEKEKAYGNHFPSLRGGVS